MPKHLANLLIRLAKRREGSVAPLIALMIIPILGGLALGGELTTWYYVNRAAQNAADSAALAAAANGCAAVSASCQSTYAQNAAAVARRYNFVDGADNATVATTIVGCPGGGPAACYQVAITKIVPVRLAGAVGFLGDTALGGGRGQTVQARAISRARIYAGFCIMTMGTGNNVFRINGGPSFDLEGCDVYSGGNMNCNGNGTWGIASTYAVGNAECATQDANNYSSQPAVSDPWAALSNNTNIPPPPGSGCAARTITTTQSVNISTLTNTCGNFTINSGRTLTVTGTGVMYIYNGGNLVLNGTLQAAEGVTIVFSGTAGNNIPGFITGGGVIDFAAPTTGTWSGIALYQDSRMTRSTNRTYSGNSPTFNITGLTYAPTVDLRLDGAINHHTGGYACMGLVSKTLLINGTGSLFDYPTAECAQAGLTLPNSNSVLTRQTLVQ